MVPPNLRSASPNPSFSQNNSPNNSDTKKSDTTTGSNATTSSPDTSMNANNHQKSADNLHSMLNSKNINMKFEKSDIEMFMRDWRNFECKTWHLEPTVRLLSWAGKSIEPYGIDYILNKLGFSHARTTIPKWLQRGFMDPIDTLQALLIIQLLSLVKDDSQHTDKQK